MAIPSPEDSKDAKIRTGRTGPLCEVQFFPCGPWEGLDPGSWILDPGSWRPGSRILDRGSWTLDPVMGPGDWGPGFWILDRTTECRRLGK